MEKADYTIPVEKNTVDAMIETLTRENKRLSEENQKFRERMEKQDGGQTDSQKETEEMRKLIEKYL